MDTADVESDNAAEVISKEKNSSTKTGRVNNESDTTKSNNSSNTSIENGNRRPVSTPIDAIKSNPDAINVRLAIIVSQLQLKSVRIQLQSVEEV